MPKASTSASAIDPPSDPVATLFAHASSSDAEAVAIYAAQKPSGIVILLPHAFGSRVSLGGEGLTAMQSIEPNNAAAHIKARIVVAPRGEPVSSELDAACDATWFSHGAWDSGHDIALSVAPGKARVWKGQGTRANSTNARDAWVEMATVGDKPVVICGSWDAAHPELEVAVVGVLASIRSGSARPNDVNGL